MPTIVPPTESQPRKTLILRLTQYRSPKERHKMVSAWTLSEYGEEPEKSRNPKARDQKKAVDHQTGKGRGDQSLDHVTT